MFQKLQWTKKLTKILLVECNVRNQILQNFEVKIIFCDFDRGEHKKISTKTYYLLKKMKIAFLVELSVQPKLKSSENDKNRYFYEKKQCFVIFLGSTSCDPLYQNYLNVLFDFSSNNYLKKLSYH